MSTLPFILLSTAILLWMSISEVTVILSPVATCHNLQRKIAAPLILLLILVGMIVSRYCNPIEPQADYTIIVIAALLSVVTMRIFKQDCSIVFALVGGSFGVGMLHSGTAAINWVIPVTWHASIALTIVLSMLLYRLFAYLSSSSNGQLLRHMNNMGSAISIAALLMMLACGANLAALLPTESSLESYSLLTACALLIAVLCTRRSLENSINRLSERWFDINAESVLSVVLSTTIVLTLTTIRPLMHLCGSEVTPLSPALLAFAALLGCRLGQGRDISWAEVCSRAGANLLVCPLVALMLGFVISDIAHPSGFATQNAEVIILAMTMILITLLLVVVTLRYRTTTRSSGQTLKEQEEELYAGRRAINEMEIKTMQSENDNLHNLLQLKRQELINVAINLSEQKEFIDSLYQKVKQAQAETNQESKDALLHQIHSDLSLRMNMSSDLDSFYAQVEQLHKDFSIRLTDKYPDLTKQERRLAMLLRLGFSSKYIATLMNIAPTSVEISRHRLRAKLGLTRDQNLTEFIKTI